MESFEHILRKHADTYRSHALSVLLQKEELLAELRRVNVELEREISASLEPTLERRRTELAMLRHRLDAARRATALADTVRRQANELREVQSARDRYSAEVSALRASASWRLTRPLRALYEIAQRIRPKAAK